MIRAEAYIKVEFDEDGKREIENAIETLERVYDVVTKVNSVDWVCNFPGTIQTLREMLNGEMY